MLNFVSTIVYFILLTVYNGFGVLYVLYANALKYDYTLIINLLLQHSFYLIVIILRQDYLNLIFLIKALLFQNCFCDSSIVKFYS